jgi:hypothetical protein
MPYLSGKYIFYSSDPGGTNTIYAINSETKNIHLIIESKFGAFDPAFNEKKSEMLFADYSSQGFALKFKNVDLNQQNEQTIKLPANDPFLDKGIAQEKFNFQDSIIPFQQFKVQRYSKLLHTFNIHSWAPFYYDYT